MARCELGKMKLVNIAERGVGKGAVADFVDDEKKGIGEEGGVAEIAKGGVGN